MALFGRKKTTVGLDIGSAVVKVAVVDHSRSRPELVRVAAAPLRAGAIVDGEVLESGLVANAIAAALADAEVTSPDVVVAVGGRDVIIKTISIERVPESQASELVRWEAEQHVPFDMDSVELDFQILDPDGSDPEMRVLLVAAKRELIERRLRVLADAGLNAVAVAVDAFALHNAFALNYPDAMQATVALLNIGHEVTTLNIVEDGTPILTRAQARGEDIAVGVERALAFLASSSRAPSPLAQVYVCGGGARTPGVMEVLGERLRVPVQPANPLANLVVRDGAFGALVTDEVAPLLMLPLGLALRSPA